MLYKTSLVQLYRFPALPVSDLIFLLFFQISPWPERTNVTFSLTLLTCQQQHSLMYLWVKELTHIHTWGHLNYCH